MEGLSRLTEYDGVRATKMKLDGSPIEALQDPENFNWCPLQPSRFAVSLEAQTDVLQRL